MARALLLFLFSFCALNAADPNIVSLHGERGPKELLHGRRATEWIRLIDPDASIARTKCISTNSCGFISSACTDNAAMAGIAALTRKVLRDGIIWRPFINLTDF